VQGTLGGKKQSNITIRREKERNTALTAKAFSFFVVRVNLYSRKNPSLATLLFRKKRERLDPSTGKGPDNTCNGE